LYLDENFFAPKFVFIVFVGLNLSLKQVISASRLVDCFGSILADSFALDNGSEGITGVYASFLEYSLLSGSSGSL
jgi:hypothetical protein